ncbi:MAG: hypothetical protein CL955_03935 [Erythrobacteraceae bacterium]|nr:hypothetical protein [Erythrobacteraceae bacterium]
MNAVAEKTATFSIQLGTATSLEELTRWFEGAAVGEKVVYASGFTCPREHESVQAARRWAEAGKAHLTQDRDPIDALRWQYFITKGSVERAVVVSAARSSGRGYAGPRPDLTREQMRALMQRLRKVAHDGEPCPSYADLAKFLCLRADRRGRMRARYLIGRLESEKQIAVQPGGPTQPLVVTILKPGRARGKSTKGVTT